MTTLHSNPVFLGHKKNEMKPFSIDKNVLERERMNDHKNMMKLFSIHKTTSLKLKKLESQRRNNDLSEAKFKGIFL